MRRYRFPLETLRRVRCAQERTAIARLAEANRAHTKAGDEHRERESSYLALSWPLGPYNLPQLSEAQARRQLSASCVHAAAQHLAQTAADREAAMEKWSLAARNVSALDRLDSRLKEDHRLALDRGAALEVDDIVNTRWQTRSAASSPPASGGVR